MELRVLVLTWSSVLCLNLAGSSHTSNRLQHPFRPSSHESNYPSGSDSRFFQSSRRPFQGSFDDYDSEAVVEEQDVERCSISQTYKQALPTGDVKQLPGLMMLDVMTTTVDVCLSACCKVGSFNCQYLWIVKGKCLAVSCPDREREKCLPSKLRSSSSSNLVSTYYKIGYGEDTAAATTLPGDVPPQTVTGGDNAVTPPIPKLAGQTTNEGGESDQVHPTTPAVAVVSKVTPSSEVPMETSHGHDHGITVAIAGTSDIILPIDSTELFSNTWPESKGFSYKWVLLKGPHGGTLSGRDQKHISLDNLVAGVYQLKLTVSNLNGPEWGEAYINVTVHPANRVNSAPVPVILPAQDVTVHLPQNLILDASSSRDDKDNSESLKYHWEEVAGPVGDSAHFVNNPVMVVNDLQPGHYTYRLTLTDTDGAKSEAFVNVTVEPEQDYPPTANAGDDQLIRFPNDEVYIYGDKSTDDKGIVSYKWVMSSGPGSVDLEGSSTSTLHVLNLNLGTYVFTLTVTDTAGHSSSDDVTVSVQPEKNEPPVAMAGDNQTVLYPMTQANLDGSHSTDDYRINGYQWTQLSGPTDVQLNGVNTERLTVTGLHIDENVGSPTIYEFLLTVVDYRNLTDNETVFIIYRKDPETPPTVSAGPPITITLPQDTVSLDGSNSADDFGIVSYEWVRSSTSPAAGVVVDGSDHKPVLVLSGLVSGTYNFTLTVTNKYHRVANDTVTLTVLPNPLDPYLLQVQVEGNISNFTQADKVYLKRALKFLLLDNSVKDYEVTIERIVPFGTHMMVEFYAETYETRNKLNSSVAYRTLTENGPEFYFRKFHFLKVDMKVCHLLCSGHGFCDQVTRKCRCSTFWMENPFKARFGKMQSNCEWSVFYVALVCLAVVVVLFVACWLCCCCCLRKRRISRSKRRIRYAILDHNDAEGVKMLPRDGFHQTTSLMVSESETEEEVLFETKKNQNLIPQKNGRVVGEKMGNGVRKTSSPKPNT